MTDSYTILSLDLGTNCGWCLVKDAVLKYSGVLSLPASESHPGARFMKFNNWLHDFRKVDAIFYEDVPRFESNKSARVYCGLLAVVQMFALVHGIPLTNIKSSEVKKDFTGSGNAKKDRMCQVAHQLGWKNGEPGTEQDHDEADAIATAWVVLHRRGVDLTIGNV